MRRKILLLILVCASAWCQKRAGHDFGPKATPADMSISCRVDEAARRATVTIRNRTDKRCYFVRSAGLIDYTAIITTADGKRLPQLTLEQAMKQRNPSLKGWNMNLSRTMIDLGPKEQYEGSFPLSEHIVIPKEGGKFRIQIGQGLFSLENDPFYLDPSKIVWCTPIDVTFPPLKNE